VSSTPAFCAALIARRYLPRKSDLAREILLDEARLEDARRHLASCGLRLVDSAYASNVGIALLAKDEEGTNLVQAVFGEDEPQPFITPGGLQRDELALAMLLWALLCLPKRQPDEAAQGDSPVEGPKILISQLLTDFPQLGSPRGIRTNLTRLRSMEVINYGQDEYVVEGPLLEILFDGDLVSSRVVDRSFRETLQKLRTPVRDPSQADLLEQHGKGTKDEQSGGGDVLDQ